MQAEWLQLVAPIALSAVLVFFASSVIHMALKYHNADYRRLPDEDAARAAIGGVAPGQYIVPHCTDPKQWEDPAMQQKLREGPVAVLHVKPNGMPKMGAFFGQWILYTLAVSAVTAYVLRSQLAAGAAYLEVFQLAGVTAWLAYSWQGPADSIWMGKPWIVTWKHMVDGLVYAFLTAGTFAWLWPAAA